MTGATSKKRIQARYSCYNTGSVGKRWGGSGQTLSTHIVPDLVIKYAFFAASDRIARRG